MKVLLVDDSPVMVAVLRMRLDELGYAVEVAENGQVGVEMFRQSCPDLVLMDLEMPVMNGLEATRQIRAWETRQQWAWTPVMFLTASDTEANLITAIDAGADDFISKVASEAVLRAKMRAMSRIAQLRNQLSSAHRELQDIANRDGLTGLPNRRALDARSDAAWLHAVAQGEPFGLLMFDLDHFKRYNDHYGHLIGDDALRIFARLLGQVADQANFDGSSRGAFPARYGGEEFVLILPGAHADAVAACAQAVLAGLHERAVEHQGNPPWHIVTTSIGGACCMPAEGHIVRAFRAADAQLYRAKDAGRNRYALC